MEEVSNGWWVVEDDVQVRSVCFVDEQLVRHLDFSVEHTVEEFKERYNYVFIKIVNLWEAK